MTGEKMLAMAKVDVPTMRKWKTNLGELPSKLKSISPKSIFSFFGNILLQKNVHFLYEIDLKNEEIFSTTATMLNQQKYVDLLDYQDNQPFLTRRDILIDALDKFARGNVLYSQNNNGKLEWFGWLKELKGQVKLEGFSEVIEIGEKTNLLCDFYKSSDVVSDDFDENILTMLHQVKISGKEKVWLWVKKKDKLSQDRLESMQVKSYEKYTSSRVLYFFKNNDILNISS